MSRLTRNAKDPTLRAEVEVALPHPRVLIKVGVGRLRAVSGKARREFGELRTANGHVMSWYIAHGLPALSGWVQGSCWPPRVHECTQGAAGKAGANAWQGSRDRVALGDVRQAGRMKGRSVRAHGRAGWRTFELGQAEDGRERPAGPSFLAGKGLSLAWITTYTR